MRTRLITLASFLLICNLLAGQVPDTLKFISLPPADFQKTFKSESDPVLIDVREFFEYKKSRLENAVNIPSSGNLEITADTLSKASSLFLYCTSGFRSKKVARYLHDKGFLKLYSLDGGITAWKKAGFPVNRKKIRR